MKIYILNSDFEKIGFLHELESVLWTKKYNDIGECEIYHPCDDELVTLLKEDNYIYREEDDMFCKINNIKIETDVENGDYIIAKGIDATNMFSDRIVRWEITYSGTVANFIKKLVIDNVIKPEQPKRKINNLIFNDSNFSEFIDLINVNVFTADLLETIKTTCKTYEYGFKTRFIEESKTIEFSLYKGKDKASISSDEYIEFSPTYDNIISSSYETDNSNHKNICYVGYKDSLDNLILLSVFNTAVEPEGKERKEIYVDGTSIGREVTLEELQAMFGEITLVEDSYYYNDTLVGTVNGDKITISDYTYLYLVRTLGLNTLAEHTKSQEFSGVVDTLDSYIYKIDYNLGDIVKVINDYGIEAEARIVEILESDDVDDGLVVEPKFEYIK